MSDTLESSVRFLGNVWGIHETDNILYFQGDGCVVKYLNGKYTAIEMNAKIDCSNMVNGILYIGTDRGVWLLEGKRVEMPVFNFKTGTREYKGDFLQLDKDDILVIEGIHGLNDKLSYALPKESKFRIIGENTDDAVVHPAEQ